MVHRGLADGCTSLAGSAVLTPTTPTRSHLPRKRWKEATDHDGSEGTTVGLSACLVNQHRSLTSSSLSSPQHQHNIDIDITINHQHQPSPSPSKHTHPNTPSSSSSASPPKHHPPRMLSFLRPFFKGNGRKQPIILLFAILLLVLGLDVVIASALWGASDDLGNTVKSMACRRLCRFGKQNLQRFGAA